MKYIKIWQGHCTIESVFFFRRLGGGYPQYKTIAQKIFIGEIGPIIGRLVYNPGELVYIMTCLKTGLN